jgi:hypothetical protein
MVPIAVFFTHSLSPSCTHTTCEHHSLASAHIALIHSIDTNANVNQCSTYPGHPGPTSTNCARLFHPMSALASAPPPLHIIRSHTSAISALFVSSDNERIISGDVSGLVVITSTRSLRSMASWKAHTDGLLGIEEWGKRLITSVCGLMFRTPRAPLTLTRSPLRLVSLSHRPVVRSR